MRFETACLDCLAWEKCFGCTIVDGDITPACEAPFEHTTANEPGLSLETLNVSRGYWRATDNSTNILACYNPDACNGGLTGADNYCASGYKGPCEGIQERVTHLPLLCFDKVENLFRRLRFCVFPAVAQGRPKNKSGPYAPPLPPPGQTVETKKNFPPVTLDLKLVEAWEPFVVAFWSAR